jgi:hypothetical protein
MMRVMNLEYFQELLSRKPFEPFAVHVSNGEVHAVRYPGCAALTRTRLVITDPTPIGLSFAHCFTSLASICSSPRRDRVYRIHSLSPNQSPCSGHWLRNRRRLSAIPRLIATIRSLGWSVGHRRHSIHQFLFDVILLARAVLD